MEPNNFEKKVQQKMDELKIPPSDLVWTNIKKRISKKHKERKVIFIIFFLTLLLFTGGYWLFNSTKNNTHQEIHPLSNLLEKNKSTPPAGVQANNQDSSSGHSQTSLGRSPATTDTFQAVTPKTKTPPAIVYPKAGKGVDDKKQKDVSLEMNSVEEDQIVVPSSRNKGLEREKNFNSGKHNKLPDEDNQQERAAEIAEAKIGNIPGQDIAAQNDADSLLKMVEENLTIKKSSKGLQKHKWILGIRFSGGMPFLSNESLNIDNNSNNYLSAPVFGISSNSGRGLPSSRLPAKIINSTAFIAGAFIEKDILKKNKILY